MANEKTPVVWDDTTKKHRPLGTGEKMGGLDASSLLSSDSGNLLEAGSDGLAYLSGSGVVDPRADNLLEESDRGKLQVTVDRIAEWLDGHPQDAAVLADAMNVVSTDAGNVIVEGTDKGAFLSKGAISAAVAGMTDAQKAQLADAIAARIASDIADGKTIVASGGKLTSDPTNATAAQKKAINQALADADSGLVVDNSTGKLKVDFSQMPTDKFEELLKGLKMQVPLDRNLHHYVAINDPNAGDTEIDGRGTEAKPWKHIQNCVTYITNTYSLNTHVVYIHVKSGTYEEHVELPRFDATSGYISIAADSGSRDVVIQSPIASSGVPLGCISASGGGTWRLENLHLVLTVSPVALSSYTTRSLLSAQDGSVVTIYGVHFDQRAVAGAISGNTMDIRVCNADNSGTIRFRHGTLPHAFSLSSADTTGLSVEAIRCVRSSSMAMYRSESSSASHDVDCSGSCTAFVYVGDGSNIYSVSTGSRFSFNGTVTGKRYSVTGGSYINLQGISADFFPGSMAGTVDDGEDGRPQTYCWYN